MRDRFGSEAGIESGLRQLPDREPPINLQNRIMKNLPPRRPALLQRLKNGFARFTPFAPAPVGPVLAMVSVALAFYAGTQLDRFFLLSQVADVSQRIPTTSRQPMSADASFYLGRSFLASDRPEEALSAFRRAAILQPDNPQYALWQGSAYYALGKVEEERRSYQQLIDSRPDYLPARLNLAHNLLQSGDPDQARQLYEEVLQGDPTEKTALYNLALTFHLQNEKITEAEAWKDFLGQYRTGIWAYRALRHLQEIDDYSYRSYQIGYRSIILNQNLLLGVPGIQQNREIRYLADLIAMQSPSEVNIVVFKQNDVLRAKTIAGNLRKAVVNHLPETRNKDVRISWFGEPEARETPNRESIYLPDGVLIFSAPEKKRTEERI